MFLRITEFYFGQIKVLAKKKLPSYGFSQNESYGFSQTGPVTVLAILFWKSYGFSHFLIESYGFSQIFNFRYFSANETVLHPSLSIF